MESDRVVQIRVPKPDGAAQAKPWFGSGYLVAPRLVLTAAHVLGSAAATGQGGVLVSRSGAGGRQFAGTVRWCRYDDTVDAALVEVDDHADWQIPNSLRGLRTRPPQRWGQFIGPHHAQPVQARGYPRLQKDQSGRGAEPLQGHVNPLTGDPAGRYEVLSLDPLPATAPTTPGAKGTKWSGISGAALLSGDLLVGVLRQDRKATHGARLTATRTLDLLADPAFRSLIHRHSTEPPTLNPCPETGWPPVLEAVEPAGLLAPAATERDLRSPAMLLRADAEAVTFHGRHDELRDLRAWCHDARETFSVRVLTGPGGQGKTRLARHLTTQLREHGWITGHLRADLTDDPQGPGPDWSVLDTATHPRLLVVDYAETLPHQVRRLVEHLRTSHHPTRLLLLARADGDWKNDTLDATAPTRAILAGAPVTDLAPLIPRTAHTHTRATAFTTAATGLARLLGQLPDHAATDWAALATIVRPPDDLTHPRYDSVLTLQMTALVTLLQHGPAPVDTDPGQPAEATLLSHEERYWGGTAKSPMFKLGDLTMDTLRDAVAAAAVCGAADPTEALTVTAAVPDLPGGRARAVARWLGFLYPPAPGRYWGSLQPDRIAEHHASTQLTGPDSFLPALMTQASATQQAQALTVMARAAIGHANAGRPTVSTDVLHTIDTALNTAPPTPDALQAASAALPRPSRAVAPLALRLHHDLTSVYRRLAAANPDAYEPGLAASLNNLSIHYGEVGRRAEGLTASEEATSVYRRLATANPDAHEPDLAASLNNLSVDYGEVGRRAEGLTASEEATAIRRRLAAANPDAHEPGLAMSLNNLSIHYGEVGRRAEGLTASEEATSVYRRLAAANPDAYDPDLAMSLNNLSIHYGAVGRRAEGLTASEEATSVYRRLAAANPDAYDPDLAMSLNNLSIRYGAVGRRAEGLTASEEATSVYRRLATANPDAHEPDLAASLNNLSVDYGAVGRRAEGLTASEEATAIRRRLAAANPDAHDPDLAMSLNNLSIHYGEVGRRAEGLTASEEATSVYRRLATANPDAHEPDLAASLNNLSVDYGEVGRRAEGLTASEEATAIRRRLAAANPDAHEPDLAASLNNLSVDYGEVGRRAEGLTASEEATAIRRRLAAANPDAYEPDLAASLWATAWVQLRGPENLPLALEAVTEAVAIFTKLAEHTPAAYRDRLQAARGTLADVLEAMGSAQEASDVRRLLNGEERGSTA
ncbi:tetratricopeptide repeat protein [Streptomyces sp. TLI_146]|uniref:tetratricopeptide repeat protein n=1 Tax=Streptomyces sp. TLI_146 TaxID=1938858 RepID=UPI000C70D406|nr:tetratricopeptide repeat protein [Streptomyces sp. TLI_146]PKV84259.1 tetratricopeptide repeat protein [Streptomyces sp. TLI_146]